MDVRWYRVYFRTRRSGHTRQRRWNPWQLSMQTDDRLQAVYREGWHLAQGHQVRLEEVSAEEAMRLANSRT